MNEFFDPEASESEEVLGISEIANIFSLLSSHTRIKILFVLSEGPKTVNQIKKLLDVKHQPIISQQLKVLRNENLITMEKVSENRRLHLNKLTKKGQLVVNFMRAQADPKTEKKESS